MRRRLWGRLDRRARAELDSWFGTLARYLGLLLVVYAVFVDKLRDPSLLTVAAGLVFFKSVVGKSGGDGE